MPKNLRPDAAAAPRFDTSGIEARILNETTTKEDVRWLVESVETLAAENEQLRRELATRLPNQYVMNRRGER